MKVGKTRRGVILQKVPWRESLGRLVGFRHAGPVKQKWKTNEFGIPALFSVRSFAFFLHFFLLLSDSRYPPPPTHLPTHFLPALAASPARSQHTHTHAVQIGRTLIGGDVDTIEVQSYDKSLVKLCCELENPASCRGGLPMRTSAVLARNRKV